MNYDKCKLLTFRKKNNNKRASKCTIKYIKLQFNQQNNIFN